MKSRTILAMAVAALFSSAAIADKAVFYSEASEENSIRDTLDMKTGGYKGWGPMANPESAMADTESLSFAQDQRDRAQHLADVRQTRDQVWVANASLREPYTSREALAAYTAEIGAVGATRSEGGGFLRFFRRDR